AALLLQASPASAADGTWTNAAGGSWPTVGNWTGSIVAVGQGFTADFSTLNIAAARTVTLDGARIIGNLKFADATTADFNWTLSVGTGGPLTLDVVTGAATITVTNQTATISLVLAGTKPLTKAGAGILALTGLNTYTGKTSVTAGTLSFNTLKDVSGGASSLGAPTTAADGTIDVTNAILLYTGAALPSNRVINMVSTAATLNNSGTGLLTLSGGVTGTGTFTVRGAQNVTQSGIVSHAGMLSRTDVSVLTLSNPANSYTGIANIANGTISINSIADSGVNCALGSGNGISMGQSGYSNTGTLQFTGAGGGSSNRPFTINSNAAVVTGGIIENTIVGQTLTLSGDVITGIIGTVPSLQLNGAGNGVLSGNISVAPLSLTKNGAGKWTLTGTNTHTGENIINAGILNVSDLTDYGVPGALGARLESQENNSGTGIGLHFRGGTLQYTGSTPQSTNRQIRILNGAGATIDASGSVPSATVTFSYSGANINLFDTGGVRTLTLTGTNTRDTTFNIQITDQATNATSLQKSGPGTWVVTNANPYSGATTVGGGTLNLTGSVSGTASVSVLNNSIVNTSGTVNVAGTFYLGDASAQAGTVNQTAGTVTLNTVTADAIRIGHWSGGATGTYNLSGGVWNALNADTVLGYDGTGVIAVSGGTANLRGIRMGYTAANGPHNGPGTINLTGGTLNVGASGILAAGTGAHTINLGAGTVGALAGWSTVLPMTLTSAAPGVTFDTTSGVITLYGALSGAGASLVKTGSGILALGGINTYSGSTTVNNGVLSGVTGGSNASTITVTPNAGTTASVGAMITDNTKQFICPGIVINAGGNGAALDFNFLLAQPSATLAPLQVNGDVTLNATPVVTVEINNPTLGVAYPLMTWTGSLIGTAPTTLASPRLSGTLSVIGNTLYVTFTGSTQPIRWAAGDGVWDINTTANWKDSSPTPQVTTYQENSIPGDAILFEDTQSGASPIAVTLNTLVQPLFNFNATKQFTLAGTGLIAGPAPLTKSGTGVLVLDVNNTFTGPMIINGGIVRLVRRGLTSFATPRNYILNAGGTLECVGNVDCSSGTMFSGNGTLRLLNGFFVTTAQSRSIYMNQSGGWIDIQGGVFRNGGWSAPVWTSNLASVNVGAAGVFDIWDGNAVSVDAVTGDGIITANSVAGNTTLTIGVNNGSGIFSGVIRNGARTLVLTKAGTGVQTLAGVNTYTGATTINAGTLELAPTGAAAGTTITVNNTGVLQVDAAGKTLAGLTIAAGSTLVLPAFNVGAGASNTTITNVLTFTLTPNFTVKPIFSGIPPAAGVYNLLSPASVAGTEGVITCDLSDYGLTNVTGTVAMAGGKLVLTIVGTGGADLVWDNAGGLGTGVWNLNTDANFTGSKFMNLDGVTFGDTAPGTVTLAGALLPSAVIVNASGGNDYMFSGAGSIGGAASLTKAGANLLTLGTANTYFGATLLNGGTLALGDPGALGGSGLLTFGGGVLQFSAGNASDYSARIKNSTATISLDTAGQNVAFIGNIDASNTGALSKIGAGSLKLTGVNAYTGGTTITNGVIVSAARGLSSGDVNVGPSGLLSVSQTGSLGLAAQYFGGTAAATEVDSLPGYQGVLGNLGQPAMVNTAGNLNFNTDGSGFPPPYNYTGTAIIFRGYFSGKILISTPGVYTFNTNSDDGSSLWVDGVLVAYNGGAHGMQVRTGAISLSAGYHDIVVGYFNSGGNYGFISQISGPNDTIMADISTATAQLTPDLVLGALMGSGNVALDTGNLIFRSDNTIQTFSGNISGIGGIYKWGLGLQTLSGVNTYSGVTAINRGTIQFTRQTALYNTTLASCTAAKFVVNAGSIAAFNVGGAGEFTASDIQILSSLGTTTGGLMTGSLLALDTTNAAGGNFVYGNVIANPNGGVNAFILVKKGSGALTLSGLNTYTGGTYLSGGQLNLNSLKAIGTGVLTITTAGAVLDNTSDGDITMVNNAQNWNADFTYAGSLRNLNLGAGAVTLNASRQVTVSANTLTVGGVISGATFGLTKAGAGTLTLGGANAYTGGTTVSAGILAISGVSAYAGSTTATGGMLEITPTGALASSDLFLNTGGALQVDAAGKTLKSLTIQDGTTLILPAFNIGGAAVNTPITNALTFAAAPPNFTVKPVFNGAPQPGLYNLLTVAGSLVNSAGVMTLDLSAYSASNVTGTIAMDTLNKKLVLTILTASANLVWNNGALTGKWNLNTDANFTGNKFMNLDNVTFTDTAAGPVTLEGALLPGSVLVNSAAGYTFTGAGSISGLTGLTKSGASALIVNNANTYTGATTINEGTLTISGAGNLGGGDYGGAILNNGALVYSGPGVQTLDGAISGVGSVIKSGAGTLALNPLLSAPSAYSGGTAVNAGVLQIMQNTAAGANPITLSGGKLVLQAGIGLHEGVINSTAAFWNVSGVNSPFASKLTTVMANTWTATSAANQPYGIWSTYQEWIYSGYIFVAGSSPVTWTFGSSIDDNCFLSIDGNVLFNNGTWNIVKIGTVTLTPGWHRLDYRCYNATGGAGAAAQVNWTTTKGFGIDKLGRNVTDGNNFTTLVDPGDGSFLNQDLLVANNILLPAGLNEINVVTGANISGVITGAGSLIKTGPANSMLVLWRGNTFTGATRIGAGVLLVNDLNALAGSTVDMNAADTGVLGFSGSLTAATLGGLTGSRNIALASYTGGVATALSVGNNDAGSNYTGVLSGIGSLIKVGDGVLTLSGANIYTGATGVNNGVLKLDFSAGGAPVSNIISSSSTLVMAGGELNVVQNGANANSQDFSGLTVNAGLSQITLTGSNNVVLNVGAIVINPGGSVNFNLPAGAQSASNGVRTTNPDGFLPGATVNGVSLATVSAGNVIAYNPASIDVVRLGGTILDGMEFVRIIEGGVSGNISLGSALTGITTLLNNGTAGPSVIDMASNILRLGAAGTIQLPSGYNALTIGAVSGAGTLTAGGAADTAGGLLFNNDSVTNPITVNSVIANNGAGAVAVTKNGRGTLVLSGENTYTGATTITSGTLQLQAPTATVLPSAIPGLQVWLDATDLTNGGGNPADGAAVTYWNNKAVGGVGDFFYKGIAPNYVTSRAAMNGLPVVQFNGNGTLINTINLPAPSTVLYVGRYSGVANLRLVSAYNNNWLMGFHGQYADRAHFTAWVYGEAVKFGPNYQRVMYESVIPGGVMNSEFYRNGSLLAANTAGVAGPNGLMLGGYNTNNSEMAGGDVGEVLAFNRALSAAERLQMEQYLQAKWKVGNMLPPATAVNLTDIGATLDLAGNMQTIGSLAGVEGTNVLLGGGALIAGSNGASTRFDGVISGAGNFAKMGTAGDLTLGGGSSNTFVGNMVLTEGRIGLAKTGGAVAIPGDFIGDNVNSPDVYATQDNQFAPGSVMRFFGTGGDHLRFELLGTVQTLAGVDNTLAAGQRGVIQHKEQVTAPDVSLLSTLILNGTGSYFFNGYLRSTGGTLNLIKSGKGTQTLSGTAIANPNLGTLTVNSGRLVLADTTNYHGAIVNNATIELNAVAAILGCYNAVSGPGIWIKTGTGTAKFIGTAQPILTTGQYLIQAGIFQNDANTVDWSGATADMDISAGAITDLYADAIYLNRLTGSGTIRNTYGNAAGSGSVPNTEKLVVGVANGSSTFNGVITDTGISGTGAAKGLLELVKVGSGAFVLTGANTYAGPTNIYGGSLELGALATAPNTAITVKNTATLQVDATGKTLKSLTVEDGATLVLPAISGQTITLTGAVTFAGVTPTVTVKPQFGGAPVTPGATYDLLTATGGIAGAPIFNLVFDPSARTSGTIAIVLPNRLVLTIVTPAINLVWDNGAATGKWNLNADANFTTDSSVTHTKFMNTDAVTFGDTAAGSVTLEGALIPSAV
ncbi:MAG: autotransporter-associated beta strand repeat-containing protein, partial [Candidatus Sumerlaeota bacterium]|nr:autotransporter-associated beta strand repeat-containing protein [Candidatus Sumerlaeota bacterium]